MTHGPGKTWVLATVFALAACSSDDSDSNGSTGDSSGGDSTGGTSEHTTGGGGTESATSSGGDTDASSSDATDTSGGGGTTTDTGDTSDDVVLQNDTWTSFDGLSWQTWPAPGDCMASVYEIDPAYYPFEIQSIRVIIGNDAATKSFEVGIWEVDEDNVPTTPIDTATVEIEGNAAQIPEIDLQASGIVVPTITEGTFAAVVCHVDHMGAPSFATDLDGDVAADRNFVWQDIAGEWVQAPDFGGINGDFILRAVILPQA